MKNIKEIKVLTERFLSANSPQILTGMAIAGTVTTAYLAGEASFKAARILAEVEVGEEGYIVVNGDLNFKESVEKVWKLYIPAAGVGSLTVASIILTHRISSRRAAAMAGAYAITEKAFDEYQKKVKEKIGENKEQAVRDEIAQDRVNREAENAKIVVITDESKVMCHDAFSNQFFYSDMETLRKAMNDVNQQILHSDYATVSDFYHYVNAEGLQETSVSGELGWNTDKFMELEFSTVLYKDKTPCISINFGRVPIKEPWRFC